MVTARMQYILQLHKACQWSYCFSGKSHELNAKKVELTWKYYETVHVLNSVDGPSILTCSTEFLDCTTLIGLALLVIIPFTVNMTNSPSDFEKKKKKNYIETPLFLITNF